MPGRPRKDTIREDIVGVYHVWSRCAQAEWLFGFNPETGKNYEHRKGWIHERLRSLVQIFAVEACVFAVLSNHFHLILRNRIDLAADWSEEEVVRRWWQLCPERCDEHGEPAEPTKLEIQSLVADSEQVAEWRIRLGSISWFMKSMNEWIAKRANREAEKSGHFFEGRFGCRNLLDEGAILACAVYIDLNEIRANLAETPEQSTHTSAYDRIAARMLRQKREAAGEPSATDQGLPSEDPDSFLCPVHEQERSPLLGPPGVASVKASLAAVHSSLHESENKPEQTPVNTADAHKSWRHGFLPIGLDEYLEFLDWNARQIIPGKSGATEAGFPPILERLKLAPAFWGKMIENFDRCFHSAVGSPQKMAEEAARTGRQWLHGITALRSAYS